jgi:hypothetical protein
MNPKVWIRNPIPWELSMTLEGGGMSKNWFNKANCLMQFHVGIMASGQGALEPNRKISRHRSCSIDKRTNSNIWMRTHYLEARQF